MFPPKTRLLTPSHHKTPSLVTLIPPPKNFEYKTAKPVAGMAKKTSKKQNEFTLLFLLEKEWLGSVTKVDIGHMWYGFVVL